MTPETHARLTELFGEAVELSPPERGALIEKLRANEPALAAELVALLVADRLDVPGLETGRLADLPASRSGSPAAPEPPRAEPRAGTDEPTNRAGTDAEGTNRVDTPTTHADTDKLVVTPDEPAIPGFTIMGVLGKGDGR